MSAEQLYVKVAFGRCLPVLHIAGAQRSAHGADGVVHVQTDQTAPVKEIKNPINEKLTSKFMHLSFECSIA